MMEVRDIKYYQVFQNFEIFAFKGKNEKLSMLIIRADVIILNA